MKTIGSVEDIRAEIQRRIDTSNWARGYCADCEAPFPYRVPDDGIANWMANVAPTAKPGCEGFLLNILVRGEDETWRAYLPDFTGCRAEGESAEVALGRAKNRARELNNGAERVGTAQLDRNPGQSDVGA